MHLARGNDDVLRVHVIILNIRPNDCINHVMNQETLTQRSPNSTESL